MTTPTINRDDLKLSFGYTRNLIDCPVCKSGPGLDADQQTVGEDLRNLAFATPDGRLCEICSTRLAGAELVRLLDQVETLGAHLSSFEEYPEDVPYARALVVAAMRAVVDEFDAGNGTSDAYGGDTL